MLERHLDIQIKEHFSKYREILILLGSRQSGKTTLVKKIFPDALYLLVDNEPVRRVLESYDVNTYKNIIKSKTGEVIIDEAHLLSNPGRMAKIIYDEMPGIKLIITGSSSFHIKNKTSESLAGRKIDYYLYPLTFHEYLKQNDITDDLTFSLFENIIKDNIPGPRLYDTKSILDMMLLYGLYPNLINHPQDRKYLSNFVDSLIFKDLLELNLIENRKTALNLLKLLAYQIGNIINYSELASKLNADQRTIKRYIEIFEQSFIVYRLFPYSGNRRDEIIKSPKIYFYDTGIRNTLINDFSNLDIRPDKGALFENFIITECLKSNQYLNAGYEMNFWRTKQKSEVDLVLTRPGEIIGVEIKIRKIGINRAFMNRYPEASFRVVNQEYL